MANGKFISTIFFLFLALLFILTASHVFSQGMNPDNNATPNENLSAASVQAELSLPEPSSFGLEEDSVQVENKIKPALKDFLANNGLTSAEIPAIFVVDSLEKLDAFRGYADALGAKEIKTFKKAKLLSAKITKEKLERIASKKGVLSVWPDDPVLPFLDDALPQHSIPSAWQSGFTGKGVKIAIIDSGIDATHPMLSGKVIASQDFTGEGTANDFYGHGTHVAGIAAGTNANGALYNGASPDALLLNARVLNSQGVGTTSGVIAGINWALDPDSNPATDDAADIINLSLGTTSSDPEHPLNKAVEAAADAGIIVIAAAGNCGDAASGSCGTFKGVTAPGNSPRAITVGAVDESNVPAAFSSHQTFTSTTGTYIKPDVVAAGTNVNSSYIANSYRSLSGTSMSTPIVSGFAALLLESNPSLTPQQVKELIESSAIDLGAAGKDEQYGAGVLDASSLFKSSIYSEPASITAFYETSIIEKQIAIHNNSYKAYSVGSVDYAAPLQLINAPSTLLANSATSFNLSFNPSQYDGNSFQTIITMNLLDGNNTSSLAIPINLMSKSYLYSKFPFSSFFSSEDVTINIIDENTFEITIQ